MCTAASFNPSRMCRQCRDLVASTASKFMVDTTRSRCCRLIVNQKGARGYTRGKGRVEVTRDARVYRIERLGSIKILRVYRFNRRAIFISESQLSGKQPRKLGTIPIHRVTESLTYVTSRCLDAIVSPSVNDDLRAVQNCITILERFTVA